MCSPIGLNILLFIPAIELCGSAEQKVHWLPLAKEGKIIGTYTQTELGHGTFVRGIETTATLDETTDEFIIHSPTRSSTKFWPGGLGFSSTHAIVMARLLVGDHDHGPHLFIVQLRSLENGEVLLPSWLWYRGSKKKTPTTQAVPGFSWRNTVCCLIVFGFVHFLCV